MDTHEFLRMRTLMLVMVEIAAAGLIANSNLRAATYTHVNAHPEIQMYSYPAASANGAGSLRDRAPTFGAFSGLDDDQNPVFFEGSGLDPSRRGSFIVYSNTADDIPAGLDPARYEITSLRVQTTLLGSLIYEPLGYVLPYDNTLDSSLALTTAGGDDLGNPMEMYGIGLQGDYEEASFDPGQTDPRFFQLGDVRWKTYQPGDPEYDPANPNAISPYQFFALDAEGRDAENAAYGGYSATEASGTTSQFTPTPFAIGKLYDGNGAEVSPGTLLKNGDTFEFEPDLSHPGIVAYLQSSLARGALGFSFSSLHQPAGHEGTVPYPDFYLDDLDVGSNPNGAAPRIEISVNVSEEAVAGDYDRDGNVDAADYQLWRGQYGLAASAPGAGADGNGDGLVDASDFVLWRASLGGVSTTSLASDAIPEPMSAILAALAGTLVVMRGRSLPILRRER